MAVRAMNLLLGAVLASLLTQNLKGNSLLSLALFPNILGFFFAFLGVTYICNGVIFSHYLDPLLAIPSVGGGHPVMGYTSMVFADKNGQPFREWVQNPPPNKGLIRVPFALGKWIILVTGPKVFSEMLVQKTYSFAKPYESRDMFAKIFGNGLLSAEGDDHRHQRKAMMPAFAFRHVKDLYPIYWSKSGDLLDATEELIQSTAPNRAGERLVDLTELLMRVTLDIIGAAGCGHDFNSIRNPDNELSRIFRQLFEATPETRIIRALRQTGVPLALINLMPFKWLRYIPIARKAAHEMCYDLIRAQREKQARDGHRTDKDIISVALESGKFTDEELVSQIMTFLAAGHETTASAMTFALYYMARHPQIQDRLRAEVRRHLPSLGSDATGTDRKNITAAQIDSIAYLGAVTQEVLRLAPTVPITARVALEETTVAGYHIPENTLFVICPWATNADKSLWGPDAEEFRPERWLNTNPSPPSSSSGSPPPGNKINNNNYVDDDFKPSDSKTAVGSGGVTSNFAFETFIHGPHSCIGQGFARAELACLIGALVGRYRICFSKSEGRYEPDWHGEITVKLRGLRVRLERVEGW